MAILVGKVDELTAVLQRMALPLNGEALFNPLRLQFGKSGLTCEIVSAKSTEYLKATVTSLRFKGGGDVVLDALELLAILRRFRGDEKVKVNIQDDVVTIRSSRKSAKLYPQTLSAKLPPRRPKVVNGVVTYKGGKVKARTFVEMGGAQFAEAIKDAAEIEIESFFLSFDPGGSSVSVGEDVSKHTSIRTQLKAKVKGKALELVMGGGFVNLFSNITGPVKIQGISDYPLTVFYKTKGQEYMYSVSPMMEDDE